MRRVTVAAPLAVVAAWLLVWAATVPLGDFPLNDDWTYGRAVQSILETGRLALLPWSAANAFAQLYWGALFCKLFGFSYETLRVSTAVLGAAGVAATYGLLREARAGVGDAALGALAVGCNPLYLSQSVTFMTDIPFAGVVTVSLWLYCVALRRASRLGVAAAFGAGLLAVLIRQFAVVVPVAFAAGSLRRRFSMARAVAWGGAVLAFAAVHVGYQHWMVATGRTSAFTAPASLFLDLDVAASAARLRSSVLPAIGSLGLALLPFSAVSPARLWASRSGWWWLAAAGLAAALFVALALKHEIPPLTGNVLQPFGVGPLTLTDTYLWRLHLPTMPGAAGFWLLASAGSCWGAAIGVIAAVSAAVRLWRGEAQAAVQLAFIAAYGGAIVAFMLLSPLLDRYFIPLLAPLAAVIATARGGRSAAELAIGGVLVAVMAAFSVAGTHDWLAWHRARWEAIRVLELRSIPPSEIDGGYEFNGLETYQPGLPNQSAKPGWWVVDNAAMLAAGPVAGFHEIASVPVRTWLWRGGTRIAVLERD